MSFSDLFVGALTLNSRTYALLRERSDVFFRGFLVLVFAGLVVGACASLPGAIRDIRPLTSKEQVLAEANQIFDNSFPGPNAMREQVRPYVTEIASMVFELESLPPRAGEGARPVAAVLDYVGSILATPFSWAWTGWLLFAGLLFQFASRLLGGRASMGQMLGLTALAAAPQVFTALTSLLALIAMATGVGVLGGLNTLLGFLIAVWSAVVYIKATAVAQNFSTGRAVGAILIGYGILIGMFLLALIVFALVVAGLVTIASVNRVN